MSANERGDCYASEMTIREKVAAMAMQGLCASGPVSHINLTVRTAADVADALLAELAKPQEPTP